MAEGTRRATVFISFASAEVQEARDLSEHLETAGVSTFFAPRDISGGMNFAVEIVKAISSCEAVIVLLSPSAIASPHVRREVSLAIDERRFLLPVAMPGTSYRTSLSTEWTYWLSAVQVGDYDGPEPTLQRVRELLAPTHGHAAAEPPPSRRAPVAARRKLAARSTSASPSSLLRPDSSVPALLGREAELARLEQWCLRDDDFDLRIVTGAAGQGKTRLAMELMRLIEARDWDVRVLPSSADAVAAVLDLAEQPTLFVIDYAETRSDQLFSMFSALLEHGLHDKCRVLLLARTATDWWNALLSRSGDVAELLLGVTVQPIERLALDRELVNQLFITACAQFAAEVGVTAPPVAGAPYKPYDSVLGVLEDALVVVLGAGPDALSSADRLLAHERRYLAASARAAGIQEVDDVDLNRIAAALTLYGAGSEDEAAQVVGECNTDLAPVVRRQVARLFRRLYPGPRTYVDGLRPDALAEALLAGVIKDEGRLPASAAGLSSDTRTLGQRRRALITLARGSMRHPAVADELERAVQSADLDLLAMGIEVATQVEEPDRLSSAIGAFVEGRSSADLAFLLEAIPDETVALADLAAQLARQTIAELPPPDVQTLRDVAVAMECSNRFSDAGWSAEAAESAQVAVDRLRRFDPGDQDVQLLGRALSNLSNRLWELGELDGSLDPAREGVARLDGADASLVERAAAHSNLAFRLAELDQLDEALIEARRAEELCAQDIGDDSPAMDKTRGSILTNLTCILLGTGDAAKALAYGNECVELRRSQALQDRDRFLPFVARALANTAPAAEAAGEPALADRLLIEARSLHQLTGVRAPIFRFEEAESATSASLVALSRGEWELAEQIAAEAQVVLESLTFDLRDLSSRLAGTLAGIRAAAAAREQVTLLQVASGEQPPLRLPRLMEYRDL